MSLGCLSRKHSGSTASPKPLQDVYGVHVLPQFGRNPSLSFPPFFRYPALALTLPSQPRYVACVYVVRACVSGWCYFLFRSPHRLSGSHQPVTFTPSQHATPPPYSSLTSFKEKGMPIGGPRPWTLIARDLLKLRQVAATVQEMPKAS